MTVPTPPVAPGEIERRAVVYVLADHVNGRDTVPAPHKNAAEHDLGAIYQQDRLASYPVVRDRYEGRLLQEAARRRSNRVWALAALDAIYQGTPVPGRPRPRWVQVLTALVQAGPAGMNRKEICRLHGVDGGKVSAAMTFLHEAGVIYPLDGVKR